MSTPRLPHIDIAKGIGILLVLLGHVTVYGMEMRSMIYAFHMPLFFLLYGCVMKDEPLSDCIKKRWWQLMIPYILWGAIYMPVNPKPLAYLCYGSGEMIKGAQSNGMLWFLVCMFFASVVANACNRLKVNGLWGGVILALLFVLLSVGANELRRVVPLFGKIGLPMSLDVSLLATAFVLVGRWLFRWLDEKTARWGRTVVSFVGLLMIGVSVVSLTYPVVCPSMMTYKFGNAWLFFGVGVVASYGVVLLSRLLVGCGRVSGWLVWLGQNSLGLYLTHRFYRGSVLIYIEAHDNYWLIVPGFVLVVVLSVVSTIVVKRYFPWLFGKRSGEFGR